MDNRLSTHKGERVKELIEGAGALRVALPSALPPDLNPIEESFSKLKSLLCKAEARIREVLVEAMGRAISSIAERDARGFFEHCGYRTTVQPF